MSEPANWKQCEAVMEARGELWDLLSWFRNPQKDKPSDCQPVMDALDAVCEAVAKHYWERPHGT